MTLILGMRRTAVLIVMAFVATLVPAQVNAASTIGVAEALTTQDGSTATVRGHVVGQPTATDRVVTEDYPNDYAIALADTAGETDTSQMVFVQVPASFRSAWGLASNADLLGEQVEVTGTLSAYFSHPGLTSATAFAFAGDEPEEPPTDPEDPPTDPEEPPADVEEYYQDAEGKTGQELKDALHTIIAEQTKLSYDEVWDALKATDEDPDNNGNVVLLYSQESRSKDANGGGSGQWNREHVWAKSHGDFGTATGPGTDIHHLRPTDVQVNSTRGNKDFDNGGDAVDGCGGCATDGDSFEPPDEVKGDVARMILYMAVRYEGNDSFADLEPNDQVNNGSAPKMGKISALLEWHAEDPPSAFEKNRNDVIFEEFQHNRNPFIDHPEWATAIYN